MGTGIWFIRQITASVWLNFPTKGKMIKASHVRIVKAITERE
jgi:hypothetical protein